MPQRRLRAVLFDIGGTLDDRTTNIAKASFAVWKFLKRRKIDVDALQLRRDLTHGFEAYHKWSARTETEPSSEYFWRHIMLNGRSDIFLHKRFPYSSLSDVFETEYYSKTLRKNVKNALAQLRNNGLKLGCVSNTLLTRHQFIRILKGYNIANYFDVLALSSEVGKKKPHPKIFQYALKRCRASPKEAAFVGDTLSRDICGAKKAGFAIAILIQSSLSAEKDASYRGVERPDFVVSRIEDVGTILTSLAA